jgi:hypothetical protein
MSPKCPLPSNKVVTPQLQIQNIASGRRIEAISIKMLTLFQFTFKIMKLVNCNFHICVRRVTITMKFAAA